jgi:ATP-dependent DNA helicase RecG
VSASPHPTAWLDWGVATVADLRERLRRPLERELQTGCRDTVVVGGLERLVATVGRPFRDLTAVLGGYADLDPETRRERVERALAMLDASQPRSGDGAAASAARRPPSVPEPGAAAAGELLDAPLASRRVDIGAHAPRKLRELGLETYRDLLEHAPRRWEDRRTLPSFEAIEALEQATVSGVVRGRKAIPTRRGLSVLRVVLEDADGRRLAAVWFNQPWLEQQLFPGQRLIVTGRVRRRGAQLELHVTGHEVDDGGPSLSTGRIVGIYPTVHGTSQAYLRRRSTHCCAPYRSLPDPLPGASASSWSSSTSTAPGATCTSRPTRTALRAARARLTFEEYLLLELRVLLQRDPTRLGRSLAVRTPISSLPRRAPVRTHRAQERAHRRDPRRHGERRGRWRGCCRATSVPARRPWRPPPSGWRCAPAPRRR